jgi:hypothetical protein
MAKKRRAQRKQSPRARAAPSAVRKRQAGSLPGRPAAFAGLPADAILTDAAEDRVLFDGTADIGESPRPLRHRNVPRETFELPPPLPPFGLTQIDLTPAWVRRGKWAGAAVLGATVVVILLLGR